MTKPKAYPSHTAALEATLASDPVLATPAHAATVALARSLAADLDAQEQAGGTQTRTLATYSGLLGNLRRIVRDQPGSTTAKKASRIANIKASAQSATNGKAPTS